MNKQIKSVIERISIVHNGEPWFGRAAFDILDEVDPARAAIKPFRSGHSILELLWHINTWALFTLNRIEKKKETDMIAFEKMDWRMVNPKIQTWARALKEFKQTQQRIIKLLMKKTDSFLEEKVDYRKYNFRFLINGMIEHNIYHLGQIAYLNKLPL